MSLPSYLYVPLGAISAAVIAGVFSFLALIIAKEHKTSEFRQAWIDDLREELADFLATVSHLGYIVVMAKGKSKEDTKAWEDAVRDPLEKCLVSMHRIYLRLYPYGKTNENSAALVAAVDAVREAVATKNFNDAQTKSNAVREAGQAVLKYEWERVKKGEQVFVWCRRVVFVSMVAAIVGLGVLVYGASRPQIVPRQQPQLQGR